MEKLKLLRKYLYLKREVVISLLAIVFLYPLAKLNYLVFHTIIEMFAVITASVLSIFTFLIPKETRPKFLNNVAIAYLNVAVVDFLHTLAYKGMGVFHTFSANQPTQFWILGRTLETIGLSSIIFKRIGTIPIFIILSTLNFLGTLAIFKGTFPDCFIEGKGITPFKIAMEYTIIAILLPLAVRIHRSDDRNLIPYKEPLISALIFTALAEASFTLYTDVYGFFNALGHLFRFISYLVILSGIVRISILTPLRTIYFDLCEELRRKEESAVRDALTGLYNRTFFEERIRYTLERLISERVPIVVAMADVDNFKNINDKYSHLVGDKVLRRVGEILRSSLRAGDIVIRYGGDEFLIFLTDCKVDQAERILKRLEDKLLKLKGEFGFDVSLSIGFIEVLTEGTESLDKLIETADKRMYQTKARKAESRPQASPT